MGTTGESPTVTFEEHKEFIKKVVELVNGRIKVVAGTGANSTDEAIYLSRDAEESGVDGILQVIPYYNKPTQRGLIAHFEKIASSVSIPLMLYNIPGRTGINLEPESFLELTRRSPNIVSIKEASGDINQMMRIIELCGDRITLMSGDDNLLLPVLGIGGRGVVSVLSNIVPADVKKVISLYDDGDIDRCRRLFYRLLPLCRAMFFETNPGPVKAAMAMLGHCSPDLRLPMFPLTDANREKVAKALKDYGLL
jgi:4-hydroxy-tetrahydrodipicolinate synthase